MGEDEVTEYIKKILGKSESLQYCEYFKGINDEKFKSYSFEDLKRVLPSTNEGELAAAEIKAQIEVALMMGRVRAEQWAGGNISSFFQPMEIDDEARDLDESGTGVDAVSSSVQIVPHKSKEVEVVILDSDHEEFDQPEEGSKLESGVDLTDEDNSDSEDYCMSESSVASGSDESDFNEPRPKRHRQVETASTTGRAMRACRAKMQPVLNLGSSETSILNFSKSTSQGADEEEQNDDRSLSGDPEEEIEDENSQRIEEEGILEELEVDDAFLQKGKGPEVDGDDDGNSQSVRRGSGRRRPTTLSSQNQTDSQRVGRKRPSAAVFHSIALKMIIQEENKGVRSSMEQCKKVVSGVSGTVNGATQSFNRMEVTVNHIQGVLAQQTTSQKDMRESLTKVTEEMKEMKTVVKELHEWIRGMRPGELTDASSVPGSSRMGATGQISIAVDEAPKEFCYVDFQGQRYALLLTHTEEMMIRGATTLRESVRKILEKYYTAVELQQYTLLGKGKNGEPRPKFPGWLVELVQEAMKTISDVAPPTTGEPSSVTRMRDSTLKDLRHKVRRNISFICQYKRDSMDDEGKRKTKRRKTSDKVNEADQNTEGGKDKQDQQQDDDGDEEFDEEDSVE